MSYSTNHKFTCSADTLCRLSLRAAILFSLLNLPICSADEMITGEKLYAQGDFAGAIKCFKHEVQLNPQSANVHYNLANCYAATRNYLEAQKEYRIVVALYPTSKEAEYSNVALERLAPLLGQPHTQASAAQASSNQVHEPQAIPASDDLKRSSVLELGCFPK